MALSELVCEQLVNEAFGRWGGREQVAKMSPSDQDAIMEMYATQRGFRNDRFQILRCAHRLLGRE